MIYLISDSALNVAVFNGRTGCDGISFPLASRIHGCPHIVPVAKVKLTCCSPVCHLRLPGLGLADRRVTTTIITPDHESISKPTSMV